MRAFVGKELAPHAGEWEQTTFPDWILTRMGELGFLRPILAFGTEEQKQEWVVPAIAGTKILCLGITEPDAGSDVAAITTRAVRDGDHYVIDLHHQRPPRRHITHGDRADAIVLVTKTVRTRATRRPGATATGHTPCARSRWRSCTGRGWRSRSPTSASRSAAARAT
ncbi:MAG TPA: acyl-CoA dehydrogenase family protein [Solirubrobacteraceae bacterium]|nr:acyl-CoA dehydrogenase family protein [Solirubrobacteraceae bacterium]